MTARFRNGREFVLDAPTAIPAVWGDGRDVLWSAGEPLLICGPQGVGKSTILQQLALARAGIAPSEFLGYPVERAARRVLYVAADRPKQIARSMRRMVSDDQGDALAESLTVWEGPPPLNLVRDPEALAEWVSAADVSDLYIDSLKDIAGPLSSDDVGSAYNRAIAGVVALGVEVVSNHHQRKASSENRKPSRLEDVYGSVWITSGAGSVFCVWGQAGDPIVELIHLKQPAEEVGPLDLEHDHERGRTTRRERPDAWTLLQAAGVTGIAAKDAAAAIYANPSRADVEKIRRRLDRFVHEGSALMIPASKITEPSIYRPTGTNRTVSDREHEREQTTPRSRRSRNPENSAHATLTHAHAKPALTFPLKERGKRELAGAAEIDTASDSSDPAFIALQERIRAIGELPDDEQPAAWATLESEQAA